MTNPFHGGDALRISDLVYVLGATAGLVAGGPVHIAFAILLLAVVVARVLLRRTGFSIGGASVTASLNAGAGKMPARWIGAARS